jgi:mannitol-1-phosphate/altronate dehydrogenase
MKAEHVFTGFGFGPIQGGLFAKEAFQSGHFTRIAIAEIDTELVDTVRANKGSYYVNVAKANGIETLKIDGVELLNPNDPAHRDTLLDVLRQSTEIATCLPSVKFYESGGKKSVASLIGEGLQKGTIIYAAENNNRAAEVLQKAVSAHTNTTLYENVKFLNTVIGKMSRVVTDPDEISELKLKTIAPGLERAFLVEEFNRILVSRTTIPGFEPGIDVFIEKDDLLPFEEAKLYGHNAIHSVLGFIGAVKGATSMTELKDDKAVMEIGRAAFLQESGAALIRKYSHLGDELFTETGYRDYAEDLLERMTNPYLGDTVARVTRDIRRKLEFDGRIFGTMQLALEYGIEPRNMALGAMAGITVLLKNIEKNGLPADLRSDDWRSLDNDTIKKIIGWLWGGKTFRSPPQLIRCVQNAKERLGTLIND